MPPKRTASKQRRVSCGSCLTSMDDERSPNQRIYCKGCRHWFHADCQEISLEELAVWQNRTLCGYFVCKRCRNNKDGSFDYFSGLARIQKAADKSAHEMKKRIRAETILHGDLTLEWTPLDVVDGQVDQISANMLCLLCPHQNRKPIWTSGDGSCLFNAVSILFWGVQDCATELRFRTCLMMITERDLITDVPDYNQVVLVSPDYEQSVIDCAKRNGYSSAWTVMALTHVIRRPIAMTYPPVNGTNDHSFKILGTKFSPPDADDASKEPLHIMWTSTTYPAKRRLWLPNHFVALAPQEDVLADISFHPPSSSTPLGCQDWPKPSRLPVPGHSKIHRPAATPKSHNTKRPKRQKSAERRQRSSAGTGQKYKTQPAPGSGSSNSKAGSYRQPAPGATNSKANKDGFADTSFHAPSSNTPLGCQDWPKPSRLPVPGHSKIPRPAATPKSHNTKRPKRQKSAERQRSSAGTGQKYKTQPAPGSGSSSSKAGSYTQPVPGASNSHDDSDRRPSSEASNAHDDSDRRPCPEASNAHDDSDIRPGPEASNAHDDSDRRPCPEASNAHDDSDIRPCPEASNSHDDSDRRPCPEASNAHDDSDIRPCPEASNSHDDSDRRPCPEASNAHDDSDRQLSFGDSTLIDDSHRRPCPEASNAHDDSDRRPSSEASNANDDSDRRPSSKASNAHDDSDIPPSSEASNAHDDSDRRASSEASTAHDDSDRRPSSEASNSHDDSDRRPSSEVSNAHDDSDRRPSSEASNAHDDSDRRPSSEASNSHDDSDRRSSSKASSAHDDSDIPPSSEASNAHDDSDRCRSSEASNAHDDSDEQLSPGALNSHDDSDGQPSSAASNAHDVSDRQTHPGAFNSEDIVWADGGTKSSGKFLEAEDVFYLFTNNKEPLITIPKGRKDNLIFHVSNVHNKVRRQNGRPSVFDDDCGAWTGSNSSKIDHYVLQGSQLRYVYLRNGTYFSAIKRTQVEMNPQPTAENLVVMRRYYNSLKIDPTFKRRVTTILTCPQSVTVQDVFIVEYIGQWPSNAASHGLSKKTAAPYVRTSASTKRKLEEKIHTSNKGPKHIYEDMVLDSSISAPRDSKQVRNCKYVNSQRNSAEQGHRCNTADDVQRIINMLPGHSFMQRVILGPSQPPSVVMFVQEQIDDITTLCSTEATDATILGIDRTFNLGPCYLTLFVYKNNNLIRKVSQEPPIMFGPMFLHWDGSYQTYSDFLSFINVQFQKSNNTIGGVQLGWGSQSELAIGSDEEKALTKAIQNCFPNSEHMLCTRHLQQNVKRFLTEKVGMSKSSRGAIINAMFGSDGLSASTSEREFHTRRQELHLQYMEDVPSFVQYFDTIADKILRHVLLPSSRHDFIPFDWTNNLCESMNHVIKRRINWTIQKIPELVRILHSLVKLQYADVRRALRGLGDFELAPAMRHLQLNGAQWDHKTEDQKKRLVTKFLRGVPRRKSTLDSTDGKLTIPRPKQKVAKKPGQKKRPKATRATNR